MQRTLFLLFLSAGFLISGCGRPSPAPSRQTKHAQMITREQITEMFESSRRLKREGRAPFDIDQVCRWSYFVIDADRDKLTQAGRRLEQQGYEVIGFLDPPADDEQPVIYLRFDKVERHTPDSLLARNAELSRLATDCGLLGYDGMEVGAVDGP